MGYRDCELRRLNHLIRAEGEGLPRATSRLIVDRDAQAVRRDSRGRSSFVRLHRPRHPPRPRDDLTRAGTL